MALLERVSTLIRANTNDLIDKAEDPEKVIKQLVIDMENQLLQVKTQVAVAIADQHMLEKRLKENEDMMTQWMHKAELAVDKKEDDLARHALERYKSYEHLSENYREQVADQKVQVENLKTALSKLEQKLTEAQSRAELLLAQNRRARAVAKAGDAHLAIGDRSKAAAFERMKHKVMHNEAASEAKAELASENVEDQLTALEREEEIERMLKEIKSRRRPEA
jgi:phage shock protein A